MFGTRKPAADPLDLLLSRFYVDTTPESARLLWSKLTARQRLDHFQTMMDFGWFDLGARTFLVTEREVEILDAVRREASDEQLEECAGTKRPKWQYEVAVAELARRRESGGRER
jgi:hypothetical protein